MVIKDLGGTKGLPGRGLTLRLSSTSVQPQNQICPPKLVTFQRDYSLQPKDDTKKGTKTFLQATCIACTTLSFK